jgi:hypothetical protein
MFDALKWPKDCPPKEAIPPNGTFFFRVVKTDPPQPDDFLTNEELGKKQNAPLCNRKAVSLSATLSDAQALMRLYPAMGQFIAELTLSRAHGVVLPGKAGHVAWWPCDDVDPVARCAQVSRVC